MVPLKHNVLAWENHQLLAVYVEKFFLDQAGFQQEIRSCLSSIENIYKLCARF